MDSRSNFFDRNAVEKLWTEHLTGRADHAHKIWLLLFFNEWHDLI